MLYVYGFGLCNVYFILWMIGNSSKNFLWFFLKNICSGVGLVLVDEFVRLYVYLFFIELFLNEFVLLVVIE